MKKKLLCLFISIIAIFSYVQAQSLWDIEVSFCNNDEKTEQIDLVTKSDQDTDICVLFQNHSEQDTTLHIEFVDWAVLSGGKSCDTPDNPNIKFTKYVQDFDHDIFLQWNWQEEKHYTIHYPVGYEWISHGCISYEIKSDEEVWSTPIRQVFRRVFTIDIMVWWSEVNPKLKISSIYLSGYDTDKRLVLEVRNKWNIDQKISLTWVIRNMFWYKQTFAISGTTIGKNQNLRLVSSNVRIPSYKWLFVVESNLINEPIFDFDITTSNLKNEYSSAWLTVLKNYTMFWSRLYIVLIVLIIALIVALVMKKSNSTKKVEVKKSPAKKSKSKK